MFVMYWVFGVLCGFIAVMVLYLLIVILQKRMVEKEDRMIVAVVKLLESKNKRVRRKK